ncbi:hypothetical protein C0995_011557 [Termitomyces sp. Mi166|nr:hypothetical protein C0995_011557 [Termitomyces sp. Mi166\
MLNVAARQQLLRHCRLRSNHPSIRPYAQNHVQRLVPRYACLAVGAGVALGLSFYLFYPDPSRSAPTSTTNPLSPSHFTPSKVSMNEPSGPDTKLLELVVPPELLPGSAASDSSGSPFTPIWSIYIKDDDIQVERPYTPLEGVDEDGRMLFWIKKYPKGEVGRWLHSKTSGETIELRGPLRTWPWREGEWDEIVMVRFYLEISLSLSLTFNSFRYQEGLGSLLSTNYSIRSSPVLLNMELDLLSYTPHVPPPIYLLPE